MRHFDQHYGVIIFVTFKFLLPHFRSQVSDSHSRKYQSQASGTPSPSPFHLPNLWSNVPSPRTRQADAMNIIPLLRAWAVIFCRFGQDAMF